VLLVVKIKQGGGENKLFPSFVHRYLKNGMRYYQSYCYWL